MHIFSIFIYKPLKPCFISQTESLLMILTLDKTCCTTSNSSCITFISILQNWWWFPQRTIQKQQLYVHIGIQSIYIQTFLSHTCRGLAVNTVESKFLNSHTVLRSTCLEHFQEVMVIFQHSSWTIGADRISSFVYGVSCVCEKSAFRWWQDLLMIWFIMAYESGVSLALQLQIKNCIFLCVIWNVKYEHCTWKV